MTENMSLLQALVTNPSLVLRHRNIFLLSHMRANTSLLGHLMGSHPQIEGYYEMHIGYFGWKSLWRQKALYFSNHQAKPQSRFMFDKVLHDGHHVSLDLLRRSDTRTLMMLRAPEQSIKSLMVLYRQRRPELPEATAEGATRYYVERLNSLGAMAAQLGPSYFYLDAECLVTDTGPTLAAMADWLGLDSPIPTEYSTFSKTGRGDAGDDSSRLKSGKVSTEKRDYSDVEVPESLMDEARAAYATQRTALVAGSQRKVLIAAEHAH